MTNDDILPTKKDWQKQNTCSCSICEEKQLEEQEQKYIFPAFAVILAMAGALLLILLRIK